jgi:hypothetical protein
MEEAHENTLFSHTDTSHWYSLQLPAVLLVSFFILTVIGYRPKPVKMVEIEGGASRFVETGIPLKIA